MATGKSVLRQTMKELATGLMLAVVLGLCSLPRVRYFSSGTRTESIAIALSYSAIIVVARRTHSGSLQWKLCHTSRSLVSSVCIRSYYN